jgi:phosphoribosylaminoimidazole-succinocarboxamide synthase
MKLLSDLIMKNTQEPLIKGKTKALWPTSRPGVVCVQSFDDITAGDGAKKDSFPGKAVMATETTCNVFELLAKKGIPVAFIERISDKQFLAPYCKMLPFEVVVRRKAVGSFLKRHPDVESGTVFGELLVEFFLKTNNQEWKGVQLGVDDPLMERVYTGDFRMWHLYHPGHPVNKERRPLMVINLFQVLHFSNKEASDIFSFMEDTARQTFCALELAWNDLGKELIDFKIEFGATSDDEWLVADVIDNDSWRLLDEEGSHLDKQVYRDGGALTEVARKYAHIAELSKRLR